MRFDALPGPGGMDELMTLVSRLHGSLLDRSRPLWEMHLIEGLADGRYAIYTKIHHALADGTSAMALLRRSMTEDPYRQNMAAPWQSRPPISAVPTVLARDAVTVNRSGSDLSGAMLSAARGAVSEVAGLVPAVVGTLGRAARGKGGAISLNAPHTVLNVPIGGARQVGARSFPLERVHLLAKHADATINDIVLAMCAGTLRAYLDERGALPVGALIAAVPVSLRGSDTGTDTGSDHGVCGNRLGVLMCNLATDQPAAGDRLETVRTCMREGKAALRAMSATQVLAMSAFGVAPLGIEMLFGRRGQFRPPFNLVISNLAGSKTPLFWNGARLDAIIPLSIPTTGQALNITVTSSDDQIVFGLTGCRAALGDLTPMLTYLDTELSALETAVGL